MSRTLQKHLQNPRRKQREKKQAELELDAEDARDAADFKAAVQGVAEDSSDEDLGPEPLPDAEARTSAQLDSRDL